MKKEWCAIIKINKIDLKMVFLGRKQRFREEKRDQTGTVFCIIKKTMVVETPC